MRRSLVPIVLVGLAVAGAGTAALAHRMGAAETSGGGARSLAGSWAFADLGRVGVIRQGSVGLVHLEADGECSGRMTRASTIGPAATADFSQCSYEVDNDGRGTLSARSGAGEFAAAFSTASPALLLYISTEARSAVSGTMVVQSRRSVPRFGARSLKGSWASSTRGSAGEFDIATTGVFSFDGLGGCEVAFTENWTGEGLHDHRSRTCAYETVADGTGTIELTLDDGTPETLTYVVGDDGRYIAFLISVDIPAAFGVGELFRR